MSVTYGTVTDQGQVREELRRIIASPHFADADRLVRFLSFVVNQTLEGKGDVLKESVVGVEVFGREPGYDPKTDPIVRVQARRLRAKLDAYYLDGGRTSIVRITLPKGGYEPEFGPVASPPVQSPQPRSRPIRWIALAVLAGAGLAFLLLPRPDAPISGSRLFTAYPGYQSSPAFSPDGLTLAFTWGGGVENGKPGVYLQSLNADTPRKLTNSPMQERNPVWLPDGQHIGFLRDASPGKFAVVAVPILGSGEQQVGEVVGDLLAPPRIEWSRDGTKLYTSEPPARGEPQQIVEIDLRTGKRLRALTSAEREMASGSPGDDDVHVSPDGRFIAFRRRRATAVGDVWIWPLDGGEPRQVTHDKTGIAGLAWSRDGKALIVSSQRQSGLVRLWRFPLGGGTPVCLTDAALSASYPAVSPRDGQIAFASRFFNANIWRIDLEGKEPPQTVVASNLLNTCPRFSPQGDRIAFRSNRTGSDEIWTADAMGQSPVRLTGFRTPVTGSPCWSPDGQLLAFDSRPQGSADIFLIPSGGGTLSRFTSDVTNEVTPAFSADGKHVYFATDRTGSWQIWKQALGGGAPLQVTNSGGFAPQESGDGKWLYYTKLSGGSLFRMPTGGGAEMLVSDAVGVGSWGGWTLSGSKIIYATQPGYHGARGAELRCFDPDTRTTRALSTLSYPAVQWDGAISVSPDGRYALVAEVQRQGSEIHLQADR